MATVGLWGNEVGLPVGERREAQVARRGVLRRILRPLLRFPLFYKILLANVAIAALGAVLGTVLVAQALGTGLNGTLLERALALVAAWALVSAAVNALILKVALAPLHDLERATAHAGVGELDTRVPLSPLADKEMERVIRAFNAMLDGLANYRRRLRDVAVRAQDAAEEERKRIARELHDDTAQVLAGLAVQLQIARAAKEPALREELLDGVRKSLVEATERVRMYARGLRPPALDVLGLLAAIRSHARNVEEMGGPKIAVEADAATLPLSPEAELALYRIVQEAISNASRHSGARHVRVRLWRAPAAVCASVEDDGRGFSVGEVMSSKDKGLGLFGMQERATYVGGRVYVESEPGAGTTVRVEIPVNATS
ncbi:MAG: sensor histidine kinase [Gemmatimonadetes bacterium]|nr:sensor histidine kinase [Gemmatimonadota bacterium]